MIKWDNKDLPHKGWRCLDVIDLAENARQGDSVQYEQCEMCGNERIRYAHVMTHQDYLNHIQVGCVCAEKMTDDYIMPRKRESIIKNRSKRKVNFNKAQWSFNPVKRTYYKKYKGQNITLKLSRYGDWCVFFAGQSFWEYSGEKMRSFEDAQNAAFFIFDEHSSL